MMLNSGPRNSETEPYLPVVLFCCVPEPRLNLPMLTSLKIVVASRMVIADRLVSTALRKNNELNYLVMSPSTSSSVKNVMTRCGRSKTEFVSSQYDISWRHLIDSAKVDLIESVFCRLRRVHFHHKDLSTWRRYSGCSRTTILCFGKSPSCCHIPWVGNISGNCRRVHSHRRSHENCYPGADYASGEVTGALRNTNLAVFDYTHVVTKTRVASGIGDHSTRVDYVLRIAQLHGCPVDAGVTTNRTPETTVLPRSTCAAISRSSSWLFVHEPMSAWSTFSTQL